MDALAVFEERETRWETEIENDFSTVIPEHLQDTQKMFP
jgi:hypothetical protein